MKKYISLGLMAILSFNFFALDNDFVSFENSSENDDYLSAQFDSVDLDGEEGKSDSSKLKASKGGISKVPAAKRPKSVDKALIIAAAEKDETKDDEKNFRNTIRYGIPSEISDVIDKLLKNEDPRFSEEIYDLFQTTQNNSIRIKTLNYFTKLEDPCLEDFAVNLLNDPYDEKSDLVKACFSYIQAVKTQEAVPAVLTLLESENELYFSDALSTIGEIGTGSEALFLTDYLERDDLSDAQRQILMRTLGKMHAIETFDQIVSILQNEDENSFVRMYAAEALGLMKDKRAIPVLIDNFNEPDPNLRQYIVKGLSNFKSEKEAQVVIIQAVRDEHWKVRQEAIKSCKEMDLKDSIPYLIYRAKNDSEKVIKDGSYDAIAAINTKEGNEFLVGQLLEKKLGDGTKAKVVSVLIKEGHAGEKEILNLALETCDDDKRKQLRYAIGKELAKNPKDNYAEVCIKYLDSKDATTVGIGLDMYKNKRFKDMQASLQKIADDKKSSANKTRARKFLGLDEEENK